MGNKDKGGRNTKKSATRSLKAEACREEGEARGSQGQAELGLLLVSLYR